MYILKLPISGNLHLFSIESLVNLYSVFSNLINVLCSVNNVRKFRFIRLTQLQLNEFNL